MGAPDAMAGTSPFLWEEGGVSLRTVFIPGPNTLPGLGLPPARHVAGTATPLSW